MRAHTPIASLLLVVAACSSDVTNPPAASPVVTVSATSAWSGDTIMIHSTAFQGADSVPTVLVGLHGLTAWRAGDSVAVLLPDTNGAITLTIRLGSGADTTLVEHVYGFAGTHFGPDFGGLYAAPWPSAGPTIGLAVQNHRLVSVDYANDSVHVLAADSDVNNGTSCQGYGLPVPALDNPKLISVPKIDASCGPWVALPVAGDTTSRDSGLYTGSFAVHIGRGRWIVNTHSASSPAEVVLATRTSDSTFSQTPISGCYKPRSVLTSLRFMLFTHCQGLAGDSNIAVFNTSGVAYRTAGTYSDNGGAAFSANGDTLFQVLTLTPRLYVYGPTGAVLRHTALDTINSVTTPFSVALDPAKSLVYVSDGSDIQVRDRATLGLLATLHAPDRAKGATATDLYLDPTTRRLYLVWWSYSGGQEIQRFDLMP